VDELGQRQRRLLVLLYVEHFDGHRLDLVDHALVDCGKAALADRLAVLHVRWRMKQRNGF
jgi:hypothetical protein